MATQTNGSIAGSMGEKADQECWLRQIHSWRASKCDNWQGGLTMLTLSNPGKLQRLQRGRNCAATLRKVTRGNRFADNEDPCRACRGRCQVQLGSCKGPLPMCSSFEKMWMWQLQVAWKRLHMSYECADKSKSREVCIKSQSIFMHLPSSWVKEPRKRSSWHHHCWWEFNI